MKKFYSVILGAMFLGFTACENVPAPYGVDWEGETEQEEDIVIAPAGTGVAADPFNVAAAVAMINTLEADKESSQEYYIKGIISKITTKEADFPTYGNHSFEMIDKGNRSVVFTAFQVNGPGKKKFTAFDQIKVGDEVVVCGKVMNFKGNTPETVNKGAAYVVSINGGTGDGTGGGDTPAPTESSKESPLTVEQAQSGSGNAYVKGFIVGYINGMGYADATFGAAAADETELLLAATADETDANKCIPVQLPSGDIRTALNPSKAENIGQEVVVYGSIEKYFNVTGVKSVTWAKLGGKEYGQDPDKVEQIDPNALTWDFTKSQGEWTIDNKKIPSELTSVWAQNSSYGMKASAYVSNTKYEAESWLISGSLDLTGKTKMSISHTCNKFDSVDSMKADIAICASTDGTTWTPLTIETYPTNTNWTFVDSDVALANFAGQKGVKIAFVYKSSTSSCGTWEVKTVTIQ